MQAYINYIPLHILVPADFMQATQSLQSKTWHLKHSSVGLRGIILQPIFSSKSKLLIPNFNKVDIIPTFTITILTLFWGDINTVNDLKFRQRGLFTEARNVIKYIHKAHKSTYKICVYNPLKSLCPSIPFNLFSIHFQINTVLSNT